MIFHRLREVGCKELNYYLENSLKNTILTRFLKQQEIHAKNLLIITSYIMVFKNMKQK